MKGIIIVEKCTGIKIDFFFFFDYYHLHFEDND